MSWETDWRGWRGEFEKVMGRRCQELLPEIPLKLECLQGLRTTMMIMGLNFDLPELSAVPQPDTQAGHNGLIGVKFMYVREAAQDQG